MVIDAWRYFVTVVESSCLPTHNIVPHISWHGPSYRRKQRVLPFYIPSIHQISTLEKTKFYQRSILSSLMSTRIQRVCPFLVAAQFAGSEEIDFHVWFCPGSVMLLKVAHQEVLSLHLDTKFIIGFDFAVTLSSPESFCVLFDITPEQLIELKWLLLNNHK